MVLWDLLLFHTRMKRFPVTLILAPSLTTSSYPLSRAHFLRSDEDIGRPKEVLDVFKMIFSVLPVSSSRSRATVPTPLVLMIPRCH